MGLGWAGAWRGARGASSKLTLCPPRPTALGLQGSRRHLSVGVLSTFCKVEGPLEPGKLLLQGRRDGGGRGRAASQGLLVGESSVPWKEQTSCT